MTIKQTIAVNYSKQSLGPYDRVESFHGEAQVGFTATKVQLWVDGLIVLEMDKEDWAHIAAQAI